MAWFEFLNTVHHSDEQRKKFDEFFYIMEKQ
jgi:hypothetical protein